MEVLLYKTLSKACDIGLSNTAESASRQETNNRGCVRWPISFLTAVGTSRTLSLRTAESILQVMVAIWDNVSDELEKPHNESILKV